MTRQEFLRHLACSASAVLHAGVLGALVLLGAFAPGARCSTAAWLQDDPETGGSWSSRYGRCSAVLAAARTGCAGCQEPIEGGDPSAHDCAELDIDRDGEDDLDLRVYTAPFGELDMRALESPDGERRRATCAYSSQELDSSEMAIVFEGLPAGSYRVSAYAVDWDSFGARTQEVSVSAGGEVHSREMREYQGGVHALFGVLVDDGRLVVRARRMAGANAILSGIFLDELRDDEPLRSLGLDTLTRGSWRGRYGSLGHVLHQYELPEGRLALVPADESLDVVDLPGGASWRYERDTTGGYPWTGWSGQDTKAYAWSWQPCSDDAEALELPSSCAMDCPATVSAWNDGGDRGIPGAGPGLHVDFTLPAGAWRLTVHAMDPDSEQRSQTYELRDARTGELLAEHDAGLLGEGLYTSFAIVGAEGRTELTLIVRSTAGANAVLSGLFVDSLSGGCCDVGPVATPGASVRLASGMEGAGRLEMDVPLLGRGAHELKALAPLPARRAKSARSARSAGCGGRSLEALVNPLVAPGSLLQVTLRLETKTGDEVAEIDLLVEGAEATSLAPLSARTWAEAEGAEVFELAEVFSNLRNVRKILRGARERDDASERLEQELAAAWLNLWEGRLPAEDELAALVMDAESALGDGASRPELRELALGLGAFNRGRSRSAR